MYVILMSPRRLKCHVPLYASSDFIVTQLNDKLSISIFHVTSPLCVLSFLHRIQLYQYKNKCYNGLPKII